MQSLKNISAQYLRKILPAEVLDELSNKELKKQMLRYKCFYDFYLDSFHQDDYMYIDLGISTSWYLMHKMGECEKFFDGNYVTSCYFCDSCCNVERCDKEFMRDKRIKVRFCEEHFKIRHEKKVEILTKMKESYNLSALESSKVCIKCNTNKVEHRDSLYNLAELFEINKNLEYYSVYYKRERRNWDFHMDYIDIDACKFSELCNGCIKVKIDSLIIQVNIEEELLTDFIKLKEKYPQFFIP